MSEKVSKFCIFCVALGAVLPLGLLAFAAVLGVGFDSEVANRLSAYCAAAGLLVMAIAFIFARAMNFLHDGH